MCRAIFFFVVLSATATAQDPVPDTTDWRSYYPLEVGNEWQYRTQSFPPVWPDVYSSIKVTGDTLVDNMAYYVVQRCWQVDGEPTSCDSPDHLIRYDDVRAAVIERHELPDGSSFVIPWHDAGCGLDLPFGFIGEIPCLEAPQLIDVMGQYGHQVEIGGSVAEGAFKSITNLGGSVFLLSGVGLVGKGGEGGSSDTSVEYAQVGGVEYGTPVVSNEAGGPRPQSAIRTYPNPAAREATLQFSVLEQQRVEAEVYDLRGVLLESRSLGVIAGSAETAHTFDVSRWPSGLYQIRLTGDQGFSATKGIIVIH